MADSNILEDVELQKLFGMESEDWVICDENNEHFNNRWFHTPNTVKKDNAVGHKTSVLWSSASLFNSIQLYDNLKRVKISRIKLAQLRRFEDVTRLEHLEIKRLCVDDLGSVKTNSPISLSALKRFYIENFDGELVRELRRLKTVVYFDTPALKAVSLCKKHSSVARLFDPD